MKANRMFGMISLIMLVLLASACSLSNKKVVPEAEEVHFQIFAPNNENIISQFPEVANLIKAVDHFNQQTNQIKVIIDYLPEGTISVTEADIMKLLDGDHPPDVISIPDSNINQFEKKGLLLDLWQLVGREEVDIPQQILDATTWNGKLLILPYSASPNVVYFNKEIFDAAKVPYPQGDWTWEQYRDVSQQINSESGVVLPYEIDTLELLARSLGTGLLSPDGQKSVGYLDSPEAVRAIRWLNANYQSDRTQKSLNSFFDIYGYFGNKGTGMIVSPMMLRFASFTGPNQDKLGVAPLPHFEDGKRVNPTTFFGYGISSKSKQQRAAWEFIKYVALTKNEDSTKLMSTYLATSKSMREAADQYLDPALQIGFDEMNYAASSSLANPFFRQAWQGDLVIQFQKLLTSDDEDIPSLLHELAVKLDGELERLRIEDSQQTEDQQSAIG